MIAHKSALVHIAVDAVDASFTRVLPHGEVTSIGQHWFALCILCHNEWLAVNFSNEVVVVEIRKRVVIRLLSVGCCNELDELHQCVAIPLGRQSCLGFDVDHRHEVLLLGAALRHEVHQLLV